MITLKKLVSLLLSIIILLMPMLAGAEGETEFSEGYAYLRLTNPMVNVIDDSGEMLEIDLSGLEVNLAAESTPEAVHLLLSVLANGAEAISGYLTLDESGLYAIVDGMENSVMIPMST